MDRRACALLVCAVAVLLGLVCGPILAESQSAPKRVGIFTPGNAQGTQPLFDAFREGMRERGYVGGRTVVYERRFGSDRPDMLAEAAAAIVRGKVDVIVTSTDQAIAAVKQQTRTIPVVMANSTDPVTTGFVASLARPGGNITGNSSMSPALAGKRVEVLREAIPGLSRVRFSGTRTSAAGCWTTRRRRTRPARCARTGS